ncbi:hypothetical protein LBMAG42_15770 [Deltaproteobacteria bacterium]|nr:hypothetical protein LBMAG42_15770 [Deltaproteobacteria bacterium]
MDSSPARPWILAWVAPLTFVVHALGAHADRIGLWGDDALYLSMAESLRRGGPLVAEALPGAPGVAKYPLLWPASIAALQDLGASLNAILILNAALWAVAAQLVVSRLMPSFQASWRAQVAAGLMIAVNTMTMDLVPQLMSEALFTLALVCALTIVVRGAERPRSWVALALCTAIAASTRNVGGLYALGGGFLAFVAGHRRESAALLSGWAVAAVALHVERSLTTLPTGPTLELLRYYVSYDVHTGWYADRWAAGGLGELARGTLHIVRGNLNYGPKSLGLYLAPTAWADAASGAAPGLGTVGVGCAAFVAGALASWQAPKARPIALLLLLHIAVFLLWTWPFSSRFWLPVFPLVVALGATAVDRLGNVGKLLVLPVAALTVALNGLQPFYTARVRLLGEAPIAEADAATREEEAALTRTVAGIRDRVRPGDVLAGEATVFWFAHPVGASAVELRNLVPFAASLEETFDIPRTAAAKAATSEAFATNLRTLRALTPPERTVWIAYDPRRMEPQRDWIRDALAAGVLTAEAEIGMLRLLSVTPAPGSN